MDKLVNQLELREQKRGKNSQLIRLPSYRYSSRGGVSDALSRAGLAEFVRLQPSPPEPKAREENTRTRSQIISPFRHCESVNSKNTIVLANSRHLMEDDQPQASTSKISEDRDDCSSVTTLTSMDSETARELCLSNSIKNAFERISSNKAGGTKYNRIVQALIFFICQDMRPFNIVEGEGFLRLVKELEPTFKVPGAKYLKKMTTEKYEACITICKSKLSKIDNFCLTLDIWTETMNEVGFMGVTIHFVENELNSITPNSAIVKECKDVLLRELKRRYGMIELNDHAAIATILDPRFKNLHFQDPSACGRAIQKLRTMVVRTTK
ncbi:hypothetical protein HW555_001012 [Spodoptera exigua]|uniref:Uncharacterized protein n=1 Tax=Spodoptera exigua TaxID=7107 RepID=A0A835L989_SPOEX|nr:hypothetical protein HW555_001012 [Spodoptera exigua]